MIYFVTFLLGVFNLFVESTSIVDAKEMLYKFILTSEENQQYRFFGKKIIKADKIGETGLSDTTTLFIEIFQGIEDSGPLIASGVLKIGFRDFSKQLDIMEILNTESKLEKMKWKVKFGKFFANVLWNTYSGIAECKYLDPNAPPRKKRPLKLGAAYPEVYKVTTDDNVRFQCTFIV